MNRIPTPRLLAAAALALAAAAACAWLALRDRPPRFHGTTFDEVAEAPDFALVDHRGARVTRGSYAGAPAVLFFGYTRCPDVCPLTLSRLQRALHAADAGNVRVLLVTVDPAHDTPAVLAAYVARFGADVTGLTGDSSAVARVMADYGAYVLPAGTHGAHGNAPSTALGHSAVIYGLDSSGRLRVVIPERAAEARLAHDLGELSRL